MDKRLMTIEEVAITLNVSPSTVRRWIQSGKLVGQKAGAQWRFDPSVVREAFEKGILSGDTRPSFNYSNIIQYVEAQEWARPLLTRWRRRLEDFLVQIHPDHVIANDRRGAKFWSLLIHNRYYWGKNLWHSTAIELMRPMELKRFFAHQNILLFDEMMQHGRKMHKLRRRLEEIGAIVTSFVCIRRRSHVESGELLEYKAIACEDIDDKLFAERASTISRLMALFEPPLDVDHLVIRGNIGKEINEVDFLQKLSKWGMAFVIRYPNDEHKFLTITLDRPQFFDTGNVDRLEGFSFNWDGPCKIRFYLNPRDGECYCSFIVYPEVEAHKKAWEQVSSDIEFTNPRNVVKRDSELLSSNTDKVSLRLYNNICIDLALKLFDDFVSSGAADDIGIRIENLPTVVDQDQLRATFGPSQGDNITKRVRKTLSLYRSGRSLLPKVPLTPPSLLIRKRTEVGKDSHDIFGCRIELLKAIPQRWSTNDSVEQQVSPISYNELFHKLSYYSESTIGRVLDYELDWGTIKPVVQIELHPQDNTETIKLKRSFYRGEYGPWFEWESDIHTYEDTLIQKTLAIGPVVVEQFLKRTNESQMTATHFAKVFSNLLQDWRRPYGMLYLGWRGYKFGAVPIVPQLSASGEYMQFDRFLVDQGCLDEKIEKHGSQLWRRYEPASETKIPWRILYEKKTDAMTRAYVGAIVRLYAAIQQRCTTVRPSRPGALSFSVFQDPLVVLASARNETTIYRCGWFEVHDWEEKGKILFSLIAAIALKENHPAEPFLKTTLEEFAAPSRLLFDKIEMYRNLPYLLQQITDLKESGDFEFAEVLLETTDIEPKFQSHSEHPVKNLEWACKIMRAFSSMVRQVLTACKLDVDDRPESNKKDEKGNLKNASFYLKKLLDVFPEGQISEDDLQACITASKKGVLTEKIASCLSKTFKLILNVFGNQHRIPDPRLPNERRREHLQRWDGLLTIFREIQLSDPYVIAVIDIYNLRNLLKISDLIGSTSDQVLIGILKNVEEKALKITGKYPGIILAGLSGDTVIFAGLNADNVLQATVNLIRETTRHLDIVDHRFLQFGLFRAGLAWHDENKGKEFQSVEPGVTAYMIGDKPGRSPGTICITESVYNGLSPVYQKEFVASDEESGQGRLFIRQWNSGRDFD